MTALFESPKGPPPAVPDRNAAAQEADAERKRQANAQGYQSTILTSGSGANTSGSVGKKTLLGS